jgi:protein gp37
VTGIEWTGRTWNPVTGCTEVSAGCDRCYARTFAERWRGVAGHAYEQGFDVTLRPERLLQPLGWTGRQTVFVNSMSDLFHNAIPDEFIARVFAIMGLTPQHTYQVLTKRHARARALLSDPAFQQQAWDIAYDTDIDGVLGARHDPPDRWPWPNVWMGVSAEDQRWADTRIPALLATPAATRFVSAEPLLGPLDLSRWLHLQSGGPQTHPRDGGLGLDWVIVGGESGTKARPLDPQWAVQLVEHCQLAQVPIFVKQLGAAWARQHGGPVKGGDPQRWPAQLRVREMPDRTAAATASK